ncbi:MAG TPA: hypothetical protein VMW91_01920 [Desulfosporosinus sp.]|nr:hypothetical protein [Desulfosporosinus sp.]
MEEEKVTSIVKSEDMNLGETQLSEQLYNSAGLDAVVDAGLKDHDKEIQRENKLLNKVLGPSGSDIKGYGESVAKRVAFAVYSLLNKQYGGKVGDLRSYILALEDERDRANTRYDELMGRVIGILGDEYKELRTDSKVFMEKLTTVLGEDLKESKINQESLAERLADIDGLRGQIITLDAEKKQLTEKFEAQIDSSGKDKEQLKEAYESKITALSNEHKEEVATLKSQIAELDSKIKGVESEKTALTGDLEQLRKEHEELRTAIMTLVKDIPGEEMGKKLGEDLYSFLLKDSKVPDMVIDGVGKFIDFKKYLGVAAERGAKEAGKRVENILGTTK